MCNAQPHPPTGSAGLIVSPATQCDMGLWLASQKEIIERFHSERLCQPLCAWDFLQAAGQGGHIVDFSGIPDARKESAGETWDMWKSSLVRDSPSWLGTHPLFLWEMSAPVLWAGCCWSAQEHGPAPPPEPIPLSHAPHHQMGHWVL